jgi:hypothetical protein
MRKAEIGKRIQEAVNIRKNRGKRKRPLTFNLKPFVLASSALKS